MSAVARLHRTGLRLLAGTDASSPGTAHGASLHDELHLLVQAGLSPTAALVAATSAPPRHSASPTEAASRRVCVPTSSWSRAIPSNDITRTRTIEQVWRAGHPASRPPTAE